MVPEQPKSALVKIKNTKVIQNQTVYIKLMFRMMGGQICAIYFGCVQSSEKASTHRPGISCGHS